MRIAIGSDHRGDAAAGHLVKHLRTNGHEALAFSACDGTSRDYPDEAYLVGRAVAGGEADRGVLVCGSGVGVCIAANKVRGVRAALAGDESAAEMSRRHNDANVLCLSGDSMSREQINRAVDVFLASEFEGGRHARRVEKIAAIERGENPAEIGTSNAPGTQHTR